jgi:hypothetical protein
MSEKVVLARNKPKFKFDRNAKIMSCLPGSLSLRSRRLHKKSLSFRMQRSGMRNLQIELKQQFNQIPQ